MHIDTQTIEVASARSGKNVRRVSSSTDPRHDQLVVYTAVLQHLLQQKIHYEKERDAEKLRLERFKCEGANEYRLNVQEQVVKKVQAMLPSIVFKVRNEYDKFDRFLNGDQGLKDLNKDLYDKGQQLLHFCKENLERT